MKKNLKKIISLTVILSLASLLYPIHPPVVNAAGLTNVKDTLTTLKQDVFADHEIMFTTNDGVLITETIVITMPDDFDGVTGGTLEFGDVDMYIDTADGVCSDTGGQTIVTGASPGNNEWGAVFSGTEGRILTLKSGGDTAVVTTGQEVCVQIGLNASGGNAQYDNPTTPGEKTITLAVGGTDTGNLPVYIVDDDTVVTTATVLATLTFDVTGDFTMGFGTIATDASRWATTDSGSATSADAHTLTASTNSASGYTITVRGATLTSGSDTISAMGTEGVLVDADTEQFGLNIIPSGATANITVDTDYDNSDADTYYYGGTASTADSIAVCSGISATTTYTLRYAANISGSTEAHTDYSASLIYVATGNF